MTLMLIGAIAMGSLVAGLFFLRSWRRTGDRLFFFFASSFFMEGVNRFVLGLGANPDEARPSFYIVRFISFLLILVGILDKNRSKVTRGESEM